MIPMTKGHFDELAALVPEHAEALAAYYDSGVCHGFKLGTGLIGGAIFGLGALVGGGMLIHKAVQKRRKQKEGES